MCEEGPQTLLVKFVGDCDGNKMRIRQNLSAFRKVIRKMVRKYNVFDSEDVVRTFTTGSGDCTADIELRLSSASDLVFSTANLSSKCAWEEVPFITVTVGNHKNHIDELKTQDSPNLVNQLSAAETSERVSELVNRIEKLEQSVYSKSVLDHPNMSIPSVNSQATPKSAKMTSKATSNNAKIATPSTTSIKTAQPEKQKPAVTSTVRLSLPNGTASSPLKITSPKTPVHHNMVPVGSSTQIKSPPKKLGAASSAVSTYIWQTPAQFLANLDVIMDTVVAGLDDPTDFTIEPPFRETDFEEFRSTLNKQKLLGNKREAIAVEETTPSKKAKKNKKAGESMIDYVK